MCVNQTAQRDCVPDDCCPEYAEYNCPGKSWINPSLRTPSLSYHALIVTLVHGGRIALVFTILGVVLNAVASLFTGVIGRLTAWRFLHIRSRQDCIASVCALGAGCCGIIAVAVFYPLAKGALPPSWANQPRPDYAWILVLVGSVLDILLAGATCMHVILPDVESPWHERPGSELEKSQERLLQQPIESDDDSEDDVPLEPSWASRQPSLPSASPSSDPSSISAAPADPGASNVIGPLEAR